jgi:hypothetical protein
MTITSTTSTPTITAVRLDATVRAMLAEVALGLATVRQPNVSLSEALRAAVRELHGALKREGRIAA